MAGDLVLIVLEIKLVVIGQLQGKHSVNSLLKLKLARLKTGEDLEKKKKKSRRMSRDYQEHRTSSPFGILRLEMMMILSSLSNVTTSATQLGAHEWLT